MCSFNYEPHDKRPQGVEGAITPSGIRQCDILLIDNDWGFSSYPLVPGYEMIGNISGAGAEVATVAGREGGYCVAALELHDLRVGLQA